MEAGADEVGHQRAVVSANRLDSLAVHLVVHIWLGEVQTSITLLVDQQVWEINLQQQDQQNSWNNCNNCLAGIIKNCTF